MDEDGSDDDSEFDYLLDEDLPGDADGDGGAPSFTLRALEEERRLELELLALRREAALSHGYGAHRQMHPSRSLRAVGLGSSPSQRRDGSVPAAAVLHLYDPESALSASLDLFLESQAMAGTDAGTKFVRGSGRAAVLLDPDTAQRDLPRIRPNSPGDLPALVAVINGEVVASVALATLSSGPSSGDGGGTVHVHAVESFLDRAGVLRRESPDPDRLCRIRPEEEVLHDVMMREKAAMAGSASLPRPEPVLYDCGMEGCSKTFRHEHVGVSNDRQGGRLVSEEEVIGE